MLGKPEPAKTSPAGDPANVGLFHEIEALSKALSLDPKPRRRPPPPPDHHHSLSSTAAARSRIPDSTLKPSFSTSLVPHSASIKDKKPSSSSSIWSWRPLRTLSNSRRHRFDCRFSLHVHSIKGLPLPLANTALCVHWRRTTNSAGARTRPVRAVHGTAEFGETLTHQCSVYGSRSGPQHSAKYEARHFFLYATVVDTPGVDLGKHRVDLTRLLPLTLEELEEEKGSGEWSTSFRLTGKAGGASLNVSFGFSVVVGGSGSTDSSGEKKGSEFAKGDRQNSSRRAESLRGPSHVVNDRSHLVSRSLDDMEVLREVMPSLKSEKVSVLASWKLENSKNNVGELDNVDCDFRPVQSISPELKNCSLAELIERDGEKESDEPEFVVIEQGIEIAARDQLGEPGEEKIKPLGADKGGGVALEVKGAKPDQHAEEFSCPDEKLKESGSFLDDSIMEELDSALHSLSVLEAEVTGSSELIPGMSKQLSDTEAEPNYVIGSTKSKSLSWDDEVSDSAADEFLSMLGIKQSTRGLSSDSDPESPRGRLLKQFEKEYPTIGDGILGLGDGLGKDAGSGDFSEDFDLWTIVHAAKVDHQKATQEVRTMSMARVLEDKETEALMNKWGLNEKVFESSPPESWGGFGSLIDRPPEDPVALPPLGECLGPCIQTKNGGFLRSMSPSLFRNCKNNYELIMQASHPVVLPAEMGSDIVEILQRLASVGIEKLSVQASKLMPLEDVSGKTMQQVAWEALPSVEACERQRLLLHQKQKGESGVGRNTSGYRKNSKALSITSPRDVETGSEYVSLEDLAPLAMDKIEALSLEGLRIQSGMSDEEAPSNIRSQAFGEISALEGKGAKGGSSLALEGAAGLQLLDVKGSGDEVDGLMGLSITLDEWMKLDSGLIEDEISDRTSKILAAHHARASDLFNRGWKAGKKGGRSSGRRWGLFGNYFTVALMVQLQDPLRNFEPVGTPMLALVQVERVVAPPKPKIYSIISEKGTGEQDDELGSNLETIANEEKKEEEGISQFKITKVHVAGLKMEPGKNKHWGSSIQQQSGSRWLLAGGMGKSNKHPFMKSKTVTKPSQLATTVQPVDTLWSISLRIHGTGAKWKELAAINPHMRNPDIIFPNESIRLH
ncbi:protein PLASTID MOVEMENT IMPAIRED 1-RELATED 1-like [Phoenix dactylifera]|uniref:Protein PLASTID MOVEMENT IMPAIRED 1-RELATED 1-like n=1 Tax=Phoenix dactylifera TaxID=42345 RepID=A0A8B9APE3_PHODC|nr:protein PLASTID MOVEMENT IMPAIRED 1-RELATED 1-like [Phoenix dactylifera]